MTHIVVTCPRCKAPLTLPIRRYYVCKHCGLLFTKPARTR